MKKKILGYKLRDPESGLYAVSVSKNQWGPYGRTWSRMCDVIRIINNGSRKSIKNGTSDDFCNKILRLEIVELAEESCFSTINCIDRIRM